MERLIRSIYVPIITEHGIAGPLLSPKGDKRGRELYGDGVSVVVRFRVRLVRVGETGALM